MYPLKFNNLYYEKIWGGQDLQRFRENVPKGKIGESWDVACHKNGNSIVVNGPLKGLTLEDIALKYHNAILGERISKDRFPLLLKIINAKEKLSVQVHPKDEYSMRVENQPGKSEIWYVLDAEEDASLVVGTKMCTKEQFALGIKEKNLEKYLNTIKVKKGEVYYIPSGLVHAIGEGITIVEIQQNSDVTYRVYDYDRDRELHVDKALDVIDLSLVGKKINPIIETGNGYTKFNLCRCSYFTVEEYEVQDKLLQKTNGDRFYIYTCVEGSGKIHFKDGVETIAFTESVLIPATLGEYMIEGQIKLLKTYVT